MTATEQLAEFAEEVAARFLQTVVVMDDEAYLPQQSESGPTPAELKVPGRRGVTASEVTVEKPAASTMSMTDTDTPVSEAKPLLAELKVPVSGATASEDKRDQPADLAIAATKVDTGTQDVHDLNIKDLVDLFAKDGLICAVLRPDKGEDPAQNTIAAAQRADILVLDWIINQDAGRTATGIVAKIAEQNTRDTRRLQLIAIYTGQSQLDAIVGELTRALSGLGGIEPVADVDSRRLVHGATRICVLAKGKGSSYDVPGRVSLAQLPKHLIREFALMTNGIVPNVAMASMAALRENTHRLLSKLDPKLDIPFLAHRAMLPDPEDARDHLLTLVGEELMSILEESDASIGASFDRVKLWVQARSEAGIDFRSLFQLPANRDGNNDLCDLFERGIENKDVKMLFNSIKNAPHKNLSTLLNGNQDANILDSEYAMLTSVMTRYGEHVPKLALGQIICLEAGADPCYFMCMQPRCDSARIIGSRRFPLLPLIVDETKPFRIVVQETDGSFVRLNTESKPYDTLMVPFTAHEARRAVMAIKDGSEYYFRDDDTVSYRWVAELKPHHARAIAHSYSSHGTRVAANPSEWLRRSSGEKT